MIISLEEFQKYTGIIDDNDTINQIYIDTAEELIKNYLGYNPNLTEYNEYYSGDGTQTLQLSAKPVETITAFTIDGVSYQAEYFYIQDESLFLLDKTFNEGTRNIHLEYTAGYSPLLGIFKMTCLRLSSLLATEAEGNIGITSKSFQDAGTRTFLNTTNYDKYLQVLSPYRIRKL